ncbi:hypothetical protein MAE02_67800 [Microvirga aerophila]|uniref:Uncharacterized protein n=1 Tax=Microvirga aerophila TaxID=670291 RepID=A0A512C4E2_9HYPH|nr:hypothetical protein MAE02_67800 [Microvirga aerophila]
MAWSGDWASLWHGSPIRETPPAEIRSGEALYFLAFVILA